MTIRPAIIYVIGIVPFGFFYYPLKQQFGSTSFVVLSIAYLVGLRYLSIWISRKLDQSSSGAGVR